MLKQPSNAIKQTFIRRPEPPDYHPAGVLAYKSQTTTLFTFLVCLLTGVRQWRILTLTPQYSTCDPMVII
jgi:hypothetical protein